MLGKGTLLKEKSLLSLYRIQGKSISKKWNIFVVKVNMDTPTVSPLQLLQAEFGQIEDPRKSGQVLYPLNEVLLLIVSAVISDCNEWEEIENFGLDQLEWLRTYYPYKRGIPSHFTLNRVLSLIDHEVFSFHFAQWVNSWLRLPKASLISIDGKTARGSKGGPGEEAVHLVNAFAGEVQMVLGQVATEQKSNEITAIPQLLDLLSIQGSVITIDAMGTQKAIAKQIIEGGADYILALKKNHPELYASVEDSFARLEPIETAEETEKNRSRLESRKIELIEDFSWIEPDIVAQWEGLSQVARVVRRRESLLNGQVETETHYFLLSGKEGAKLSAGRIRGHWGIENGLHWRLDMYFREDLDRKKIRNAAANFSAVRKMVQNLLINFKAKKASVHRKRKLAARNPNIRDQIIQGV